VVKIPEPQEQQPAGAYSNAKAGPIQYNGAPVARPAQLRPQAVLPTNARKQQTQQYLQVIIAPHRPGVSRYGNRS